jgi:hypothetical protein
VIPNVKETATGNFRVEYTPNHIGKYVVTEMLTLWFIYQLACEYYLREHAKFINICGRSVSLQGAVKRATEFRFSFRRRMIHFGEVSILANNNSTVLAAASLTAVTARAVETVFT